MIALLDNSETNETPQVIEVCPRLEKELEGCSAKTLSDLTPKKISTLHSKSSFLIHYKSQSLLRVNPYRFMLKPKSNKP